MLLAELQRQKKKDTQEYSDTITAQNHPASSAMTPEGTYDATCIRHITLLTLSCILQSHPSLQRRPLPRHEEAANPTTRH